jgi:hypothetical protein
MSRSLVRIQQGPPKREAKMTIEEFTYYVEIGLTICLQIGFILILSVLSPIITPLFILGYLKDKLFPKTPEINFPF